MKKIYFILTILLASLFVSSCQDEYMESKTGYLRLEIGTNIFVNPQTKVVADYNPKQIAVQIIDATNTVVNETDDWETWSDKQFRLKPGTYTIKASSNGFDGSESGFDIPYYAGSEQITIESGKEKTANIICTLANVKVTVNFDQSFVDAFQSAKATVASKLANVDALDFKMGTFYKSAYFPVGNLSTTISVINKSGKQFSQTNDIKNVKARDHYILNYKVADSGSMGNVNVSVDETQTVYTFTFNVSTQATTKLAVKAANAWSTFAFIEGEIASAQKELDPTKMLFEYKLATTNTWTAATATQDGKAYRATLTSLKANTTYDYRMVYRNGSDEFASDVMSFTTEDVVALYNGNMDNWFKTGKTIYAISENDYNKGIFFWDSSNPGTTTGIASMVNVNPTQGNSTIIHTAGGKSAELKSQYASALGIGKFAAASLYTGKFDGLVGTNGAKINFGQPFTSRPTRLHGWFQYSAGIINYVGSNTPASLDIKKDETIDLCSVYIALTTKTFLVNNTDTSTFIDFENDESIIAYGELPLSESGSTNGQWKEINIDLKYRNLTTKPTHIIIVCSSSRYGDYFTGSTSSLMYVDDLELIYGNNPILKQ